MLNPYVHLKMYKTRANWQSLPAGASGVVTWSTDGIEEDTHSMFDASVSGCRIKMDGYYLVTASLYPQFFTAQNDMVLEGKIILANSNLVNKIYNSQCAYTNTNYASVWSLSMSSIMPCKTNDVIYVNVKNTMSATGALPAAPSANWDSFAGDINFIDILRISE